MAEKTTQTIYIEADPDTVMKVIADIDSYPQWISEYKEAEVVEKDADGYPKVARIVMDATVLKDTMVMSYQWPKDRRSVSWTLVSSSLLRALEGSYRLAPKGIRYRSHLRTLGRPGHADDRPAQAQGRAAADRHRVEGSQETSRG